MAIKSAKSRDELNTPIRQGLEFLCQTFGHEVDPWERKAYERTLKGVAGDVLAEAAQILVDQAAGGRKFYPMPKAPDWKAAAATVIQRRLEAARKLHLADCDHSSQWIDGDNGVVERCPCWKRMQAAIESIGQLALPAATDENEATA